MIKINVIVKDKNWLKFIKNPETYLKRKIKLIQSDNFFKKNMQNMTFINSGRLKIFSKFHFALFASIIFLILIIFLFTNFINNRNLENQNNLKTIANTSEFSNLSKFTLLYFFIGSNCRIVPSTFGFGENIVAGASNNLLTLHLD